MHRLLITLAVLTLVTACGGKSPTAPTAHVTGLAIVGANAVLTGLSSGYAVTATAADGSAQTVSAFWSSSTPEVATVDSSGQLQGRSHGSTTLTASARGLTASKTVNVVNNYGGAWTGRFRVNRCEPPALCAALDADFFDFDVFLNVSQNGTDLSEVSATLFLPNFFHVHASMPGRITADGRLNIGGSSEIPGLDGRTWATFDVSGWDTSLAGDEMKGGWTQRFNYLEAAASESMENQLVSMKRTSNTTQVTNTRK